MRLQDIKPAAGAKKKRKRVGRGNGSGHGTTSGRGTKGQNSRSGRGRNPRFEGGQMPIHMRIPKLPGFKNINRVEYLAINVSRLDSFEDGSDIGPQEMMDAGIVNKSMPVKILGNGEISKPLTIRAHAFSKTAITKIEAAGGKVEVV